MKMKCEFLKKSMSDRERCKYFSLIITGLFLSLASYAQSEKEVDSRINHVTVFLDKAQVTRELRTKVEAGKTSLILTGLSSQLDQQSIQVNGRGNFIILGISHNQNFLNETNKPKKLQGLVDSLDFYSEQLTIEQNQKDILGKEEQLILSNQKIGGTQQNLSVTELKSMADFFRARLSEIGLERIKSDENLRKLNERIIKLNKQITDQRGAYSRNTSEIVISISSESSTNAELEVNYIVSNAGWYPVYDLRAINTKNPIQLNYKANVFQNTGEEWNNVKLTLSTANPSLGGVKPELYTWYLDFLNQVGRGYDKVKIRGMASMPMEANDEMLMEAESSANYVSTIQTSLTTEFAISLPYTVASTSKPTVVDIKNYEMKADYHYAVAPKLEEDAFLIAKAIGWEEFNLLPGEANVFFEGTFVGKTFIDPNSIKDTLSVSLGRDKRVVVKREKLMDYTTRRTIGSNQRDSFAWEISVRNTKNEAIKIVVEDHIPVSQNSQIDVTVTDIGSAKYNQQLGRLTWELTLQPNESKKVQYKYEVKYPKDKILGQLY
jgi:uncharacterized protein (TIGR02231 family)